MRIYVTKHQNKGSVESYGLNGPEVHIKADIHNLTRTIEAKGSKYRMIEIEHIDEKTKEVTSKQVLLSEQEKLQLVGR